MENKIITLLQLEAQIEKIQTLVDKGLKLTVITPELSAQDTTKLFTLHHKTGFMVFKPAKINEEDIMNLPEEVKEFKSDKSPSQRLRAVIYLNWKRTKQTETFDIYYRKQLEYFIDKYKEKLE